MIFLFISYMLITAAGLLTLVNWTKLPPELPWFYSLPWGENQLIPKLFFALGLLILLILNIVNTVLARVMGKKDRVVGNVIRGATMLITILYLISFLKVLSLFL